MSNLIRLTPAQWHLLIRAALRGAPITDVYSWMSASDASADEVTDLEDRRLIAGSYDGRPQRLRFRHERIEPGCSVRLTGSVQRHVLTGLYPQYRVLRYLDSYRSVGVPLRHLRTADISLDTLYHLDEQGLMEVGRSGTQQGRNPVRLATINRADFTNSNHPTVRGLYAFITVTGRPYAQGEDLY
ncbi:hypothetical protein ABT297_10990 [Dactylosporangium sp. NPDC000555]|uniref:hypothetical protein n=1 Tax=Dactylosporangium sp. NPDC000555 TaxID=3154260 RepID=UPI0033182898